MPSKTLLSDVIEKARALGADAADALLVESTDLMVRDRLGHKETVERSEDAGLGLRVFVGAKGGYRTAIISTSDLSEKSLDAAIARSVEMANAAPIDPYVGLAPQELLAKTFPELGLCDSAEPSAETLFDMASRCESAALQVAGVTNSEGSMAEFGKSQVTLATSHGFLQSYRSSSCSVSTSVIAGEGDKMETDYEYTMARHLSKLKDPSWVGTSAGKRAVARLNSRKVKTQECPVFFEARVARDLLRSFLGAINGSSIARKTSFLKNALHTQLFDNSIQIFDDPLIPGAIGSHPFDGEGVAVKKRALVEKGVLQTWLLDMRTANQLGLTTTGHASRSTSSPPSPSSSNVYLEAGGESAEQLISSIKNGFYCTEAFGMGVNGVTGDYSQGASGFWIENGKIAYPVSELTIASNLKDMFRHLTPANDLEMLYGTNSPSVLIPKMTIAGE